MGGIGVSLGMLLKNDGLNNRASTFSIPSPGRGAMGKRGGREGFIRLAIKYT
jgi:hypothetical protein